MNKLGIVIGVIAIVAIIGGLYSSRDNKEIMEDKVMEDKVMEEKSEVMEDKVVGDKKVMTSGSYESYSSDKLARAETGDVVLFFHASWCPSCRLLNTEIESNVNSIPEGVSILKLNFDTETELKKKYGVTSQHTLVQVDKDGNMIKKWSGGDLNNIIEQLK